MGKIGVGIIGVGGIAQAVHIPELLADNRFKITAICDLSADRLKEVGEKLKIPKNKRFLNYKELIDDPLVDVVDIATSNDAHFKVAHYAIQSEKSFSLEKPVTLNYSQAKVLKQCTQKRNVSNMICFSYRYKSAARYCRHLIQNKKSIGEITHVNAQYFQSWGLPESKVGLEWRFDKKKSGSGALGDLGSHMLDLVMFITNLEYTAVSSQLGTYIKKRKKINSEEYGVVDVDDYSNFLIDTKQEAPVVFEISRLAYGRGNYQRIEVYGTKGCLIYILDEKSEIDELFRIVPRSDGNQIERLDIPTEFKKIQMSAFGDVIENKGDGLNADIIDGARNQYYLDKIVESSEKSKKIYL